MGSPPGLGADSTRTVRATHGLSRSANFRTRRSRTPGATAEGSLAGNDSFSACDHRPRVATLATGETNCTTSTATWLRNDSMPPEHSLLTYAGTPVLLKISRMIIIRFRLKTPRRLRPTLIMAMRLWCRSMK